MVNYFTRGYFRSSKCECILQCGFLLSSNLYFGKFWMHLGDNDNDIVQGSYDLSHNELLKHKVRCEGSLDPSFLTLSLKYCFCFPFESITHLKNYLKCKGLDVIFKISSISLLMNYRLILTIKIFSQNSHWNDWNQRYLSYLIFIKVLLNIRFIKTSFAIIVSKINIGPFKSIF